MFQKDLFKDKIVLVTGGGSGIGYSIAKEYLSLGAIVYIASRNAEKIEKAVSELKRIGDVRAAIADIRETEHIEALAQKIKEEAGRLDILVNNAGGQFPSAAENISYNGFRAVITNNLIGTFYVTQIMAKTFFIPQKEGNIVNIIANIYKGFPGMVHTGAARAGVDNLTKTLAIEWVRFNIRVNAVAPGIIRSSGMDTYPPQIIEGIESSIPNKRMGTTEEVAYPVVFLSSPMASYISGETLYVDAGNRLWGDQWKMWSESLT
ncbi:MAG TPA: SDR family oxidoreductase [Chitinophagales bacterium]|jgi:citronellol/citronellal dehydrogenase|nr:SDR family oxidoreductase [Chitinophagales bacterium]MBP6153837.1 SDR family oxidoreductase [Chitinophagales bacterium]HQV78138.1 SDR family oxidoreductase [Chitinophagales bacterium]HQW79335.1 SDR family oxidoreductase [Chitinophagales bacterium]HRB67626.1 SDR family oxidoreductase [Chitinophagales bacterium]